MDLRGLQVLPGLAALLLAAAAAMPAPPASGKAAPGSPAGVGAAPPTPDQIEFFEKSIRPLLSSSCYRCHSATADKVRGGLRVDTLAALLAGGDTGPAIVPGDPDHSLLITAVRWSDHDLEMPPKKKLPDESIKLLERWVAMGAPHPDALGGAPVTPAPRAGIDIEKGRDWWAFKPPVKIDPPATKDAAWARTPVDRFLLAGIEAKGLRPAPDADRRALIRRVTFDLTGLPPTPEEIAAFEKDRTPQAYEKLVDRLLASPAYGERWGRHWLDVARFAESSGKESNVVYPHAWRYRDYVIDSFAADKPFDRFLREQLAGDLMPAANDQQRAEQLVATGYLAIGSKGHNTRGVPQFAADLIDEQIDAMSQGMLGITIACARCHDHKFDPIPQRDYYAMAGIFLSTQTMYGTYRSQGNAHPATLAELPAGASMPNGPVMPSMLRDAYKQQLARAEEMDKEAEALRMKAQEAVRGGASRATALSAAEQQKLQRARFADGQTEAAADLLVRFGEDGKATATNRLAMAVKDREKAQDAPLLSRGEIDKPGDRVPRGVPQVLVTAAAKPIRSGSGRMELANWVSDESNPLTARVWANRVWQHLFGDPLVGTPNNFGANGVMPTNQALLDWIAVDLMEHDWSTKHLVKSLVMSHAYQMSSRADARALEVDPDNTLVWRMPKKRLEAESIRDAMLMAAGLLQRERPVGSVAALMEGADRNPIVARLMSAEPDVRSVYLPVLRDHVVEMLDVFDFAEPAFVSAERDTTSVPTQALFMMNSERVTRAAQAMADRLIAMDASDPERVRRAFELCFGRRPTQGEMTAVATFFKQFPTAQGTRDTRTVQRQGWTAFCQALFQTAEFRMLD
ncbi:MAG: PSD1 and planctomycete cytochrome C domain-containing protein [Phycisphaerales bacterium]